MVPKLCLDTDATYTFADLMVAFPDMSFREAALYWRDKMLAVTANDA